MGINDQVVWRYSHFQLPLTTIDPFPDKTKFAEHVEIIYAIIAPFYWIWSSPVTLLLLQAGSVSFAGIAVYLLCKNYNLAFFPSLAVMVGYLMFYGVQFGLWTDVHSSVFATAFLTWFIYFFDARKQKLALLFFFLTLTAKESTGSTLFVILLIYFLYRREKVILGYMLVSLLYIFFIFFVFYPHIMQVSYLYANQNGLISNVNPYSLIDNTQKRITIFYSFASWGFLPLLSSLWLIPIISHFYKYFVIASDLVGAHGLFGHYRIMLTPMLTLASVWTIKRFNYKLQMMLGIWLLLSTLFAQYTLHLPLSYLSKEWFWQQSNSVDTINETIKKYLPANVSVVSQNNITPHLSQRDKIYTLYPKKKIFTKNSPCSQLQCNWFRWDENPKYLIVDTSSEWDARHLLIDRPLFIDGLRNLEKAHVIEKYKQIGNTILYKIKENPEKYN